MQPIARALVVGVALFFGVGLRGAGQAQERPAASERGKLPEWMSEFLPKTPEERAKAAMFDAEGSDVLRLGRGLLRFSCGLAVSLMEEPPLYRLFLEQTVCPADAVVVGTPTPLAVRLNNRGTWLYTEHSFKVRRWVHPASETASDIEVLTSGGVLYTQGETTAAGYGGPSLGAGKEYLVFLSRIPGTRAFRIRGRPVSEADNWTSSLQSGLLPYELQNGDVPFDRFIDDLAIAAYACRKR